MHKLHGFDGCQWLRCRQALDKYRRDCVDATEYFEAALADARGRELARLEGQWQREVLLGQFLTERRKLGCELRNEFKELLLTLDQSFKVFKAEKKKRRAAVGQKKTQEHSEHSESWQEVAEEEELSEDEVLEVLARRTWSEEIQDSSKAISSPDPVKKQMVSPVLPETLPCRVHSVKAIELKDKARKLALVQRYAAAAKVQAKAKKIEEEWYESHLAKVKEKEKDLSQEILEREKLRLEKHLQEEQRALSNDALRAQQQLLQQHCCRKDRLVRRQLKIWKSVGASQSLEEALRKAAGRETEPRKGRPVRPASAPARRK